MESSEFLSRANRQDVGFSVFDLVVVTLLAGGGLIFFWDSRSWAPDVYIGDNQFGDASFWWQGALQISDGVFWNNINFTSRMGYAAFAGPLLTFLGSDYAVFHKFLIFFFLAVAASVYVVSVSRVGRTGALALMASLIFAPLQAQFLAISTSDGLGLIWNLIALLALWCALDGSKPIPWLVLAGFALALGGLTRPLMTLFAGPTAILVLLSTRDAWGRRIVSAGVFLAALALPTLLWATVFYVKTGTFGVAGHDASIFYAVSNPKVQVWSGDMYTSVEAAGKARLGTSSLTTSQLNDEFRRETIANYWHELGYHIRRLPSHIHAAAAFSFRRYTPTSHSETLAHFLILGLFGAALIAGCILDRRPRRAALVGTLVGLSLWSLITPFVVIAAAIFFLLPLRRAAAAVGPIHRTTAAYWWTGVAALYFTGGTWGPPITPIFDINALGYRLGLQFLFSNEWLLILAISAAGGFPRARSRWLWPRLQGRWGPILALEAGRPVRGAGIVAGVTLAGFLMAGASVAGYRGWRSAHAVPVPMPTTAPLVAEFCATQGGRAARPARAKAEPASVAVDKWGSRTTDRWRDDMLLVTGAVGPMLWQIAGQQRTRATFNPQDFVFPLSEVKQVDMELPGLQTDAQWRRRQGAWVFRDFGGSAVRSHLVQHESLPIVQLFVPLSAEQTAFDFEKATQFPIGRYASALTQADRLKTYGGSLEWMKYPTSDYKRRWFILQPNHESTEKRQVAVEIDLSDALGQRELSFGFRVETVPGNAPSTGQVSLAVEAVDTAGQARSLLDRKAVVRDASTAIPTDDFRIDVPADATRVRIAFNGLTTKEMVRVVELQLLSDDVAPGLAKALCAAPVQGGSGN